MGVFGYHDNASIHVFDGVGINLEVSVVDLSTGQVGAPEPMRGEEGWTLGELKQYIGEVRGRIFMSFTFFHLQ